MMMAQGGVSLPVGYTKLEYLESDGNSYIDTGFKPNQDTRVVCDAQVLGSGETGIAMATDAQYYYTLYVNASVVGTRYGNQGPKTFASNAPAYNKRLIYDKNKNVTTVGGYTISHNAATFQLAYSLYLFARNNAGTTDWVGKVRLYSCQIYDNGVLVRDFIPCTNPDGISGLWDSVNNVFYKMLPAGYTKLDFIESDGTTYIDTGFKPNNNTRVVFEGYNNSTSSGWIFGAWKAVNSQMFCASALSTYNICYGTKIWANATMPVGPISIDINKNAYTYNGVSGTLSEQTFSCDYSMYLFHINAAGTVSTGSFNGRIYSVKIYDNGTLVRDFIPAMNASGEVGLYDLKNDVWYALKPVVTKKENKISLKVFRRGQSITLPNGNTSTIRLYYAEATSSTYVASTMNVDIAWELGDGSILTETLILQTNGLSTEALLFDDYSNLRITSISPTEDDTYIYTF